LDKEVLVLFIGYGYIIILIWAKISIMSQINHKFPILCIPWN
jgi:hypothetical protein